MSRWHFRHSLTPPPLAFTATEGNPTGGDQNARTEAVRPEEEGFSIRPEPSYDVSLRTVRKTPFPPEHFAATVFAIEALHDWSEQFGQEVKIEYLPTKTNLMKDGVWMIELWDFNGSKRASYTLLHHAALEAMRMWMEVNAERGVADDNATWLRWFKTARTE